MIRALFRICRVVFMLVGGSVEHSTMACYHKFVMYY